MKKLILAMIAGAATMGAAHAEGAYVGIGVANADHSTSIGGVTGGSGDGYKASGKVFGGVELDKTWGVEAGYTDFRGSNYNYTVGGVPANLHADGHAYYLAGKGMMALTDQFSLFGKLGVAQTKATLSHGGASTIANQSDSNTGVYGALGVQFNLSKQVALTGEFERYGKERDFGAKANVWTVAARYTF